MARVGVRVYVVKSRLSQGSGGLAGLEDAEVEVDSSDIDTPEKFEKFKQRALDSFVEGNGVQMKYRGGPPKGESRLNWRGKVSRYLEFEPPKKIFRPERPRGRLAKAERLRIFGSLREDVVKNNMRFTVKSTKRRDYNIEVRTRKGKAYAISLVRQARTGKVLRVKGGARKAVLRAL